MGRFVWLEGVKVGQKHADLRFLTQPASVLLVLFCKAPPVEREEAVWGLIIVPVIEAPAQE